MTTEVLATCHVHSAWSYDGSWTLEALSAEFARRGSRVLMMTEHDRGFTASRLRQYREACQRASSDKILVVPGIEYSDSANQVHLLVWGSVPFLGEGLPTSEVLAAVRAGGGVTVLAHPSRRHAWKSYENSWTDDLLGIEVWNRKYDGWAPSQTAPRLLNGAGAIPFVGLDFHTQRQFFPLTMTLDMHQPVSEVTVLECLKSRRCYARAFGRQLHQGSVALPLLGIAEQSRRTLAAILRRSRAAARRQTAKQL